MPITPPPIMHKLCGKEVISRIVSLFMTFLELMPSIGSSAGDDPVAIIMFFALILFSPNSTFFSLSTFASALKTSTPLALSKALMPSTSSPTIPSFLFTT